MKTAKVLQYNKRLIIGEASLNANSLNIQMIRMKSIIIVVHSVNWLWPVVSERFLLLHFSVRSVYEYGTHTIWNICQLDSNINDVGFA